jgi:lycopene cyclase domain-containing protein
VNGKFELIVELQHPMALPEKYYYLVLESLCLLFPLAASFISRLQFYKRWKAIIASILIPAFLFVAWDSQFAALNVWRFDARYIIGVYFFNLPIEEILFFFVVPFACLFTFHVVTYLLPDEITGPDYRIIKYSSLLLLIKGVAEYNHRYICATLITFSILQFAAYWFIGELFLRNFFVTLGALCIPFLIMDGFLTGFLNGHPIVIYNENEILGTRFFTIPIEDFVYGALLVLSNVFIFDLPIKQLLDQDHVT